MSGETPAAHLARIKVTFAQWSIWHGTATGQWHAAPPEWHRHRELVSAPDLGALETAIIEADTRQES